MNRQMMILTLTIRVMSLPDLLDKLINTLTMQPEQPETEKKIWVEPELTLMSAKKIRSGSNADAIHEQSVIDDIYTGPLS